MHQHDHERFARVGMPEAVLCGTKSIDQVRSIVSELTESTTEPRLFTRLGDDQLAALSTSVTDRVDDDRDVVLGDDLLRWDLDNLGAQVNDARLVEAQG